MLSVIFSRAGLVILLLAVQLLALVVMYGKLQEYLVHFYGLTIVFSVLMEVHLLNSRADATSKLTWLTIIMILPVFGVLLYFFVKRDLGHRALMRRSREISDMTRGMIPQDPEIPGELEEKGPGAAGLARYLLRNAGCPVHKGVEVTYFPDGSDKFRAMLNELEKAEKFIYLEYFIIAEGEMWGETLEILARKASEGVDVRVMYDGTCEFSTLPRDYPKRLAKLGIKCKPFARVRPFVSTHYNYRDHRKILVIDGHTAFTGGVNLSDENINKVVKHGHWKDTAIMLKGPASITPPPLDAEGFVIPYGDCPVDADRVGEQVYIDILNRAERYVHIMTPYLILDGETENALRFAAKRGVEVKLLLPGVPDKKLPWALAFTHYPALLDAGVEIAEYSPGFVHAKVFAADGREAVVGTINLDYRSLYHHYECAAWMYGTKCIPQIEDDFQATWAKCRRVTKETLRDTEPYRWILGPAPGACPGRGFPFAARGLTARSRRPSRAF